MAVTTSRGNAAVDSVASFSSAARGLSTESANSRASARILTVSSGSSRSSASSIEVRGRASREERTGTDTIQTPAYGPGEDPGGVFC